MEYKIYTCDLCGKKRDKRFQGEITVGNGKRQCFPDVCGQCVEKVENLIAKLKKEPTGIPIPLKPITVETKI